MYSFNSRVRYSEVGVDLKLDPLHAAQYMQDCSILHSEDVGRGLSYTQSHKRAWLVVSWQIEFNRMPDLAEPIKISTWPYDFKGILGNRNFLITDSNDVVCACANTVWAYYDTENRTVTKFTPEDIQGYEIEDKYDMEYLPRRIPHLGPDGVEQPPVTVTNTDLDNNNHVNNCSYIRMALNCIPNGSRIKRLRVEYKEQAHFGDTIYPFMKTNDNAYTVELRSVDGRVFAATEITICGKEQA